MSNAKQPPTVAVRVLGHLAISILAFILYLAPGPGLQQASAQAPPPDELGANDTTNTADAGPGGNDDSGNDDSGNDDSADEALAIARDSDASFDSAPRPDQAAGFVVGPDNGPGTWRKIGQGVLYPFRGLWYLVWGVPRLSMWAFNRYQVETRFREIFFNDTETIGVYPVAFFETGFGANFGGRIVLRDLLGEESRLRVRASYGGRFRQLYSGKYTSGTLLGDRVELEIIGEFEIFPKSRFAGIGNSDLVDPQAEMDPIDALRDTTAVESRYRHDDISVELATTIQLVGPISLRPSFSYKDRTFKRDAEAGGDAQIVDVYDTASLVGFDTGLSNIYPELELHYDTRRVSQYYLSKGAPSTGWHISGFAGYQYGIGDDPTSHIRWGVDVQRYINLYAGDRVLHLRAYVEGVTGDLAEVPFVDLPRLGGSTFLRGYPRDRFRDRHATLATAEYNYPVNRNIGAYLFVDAGRVWRTLEDIGDDEINDDIRVGFGGGIQLHSMENFLARLLIASSVDGELFINFSLDPAFDTRSREESP